MAQRIGRAQRIGLPANRVPPGFKNMSRFSSPTPKLKGFNKGEKIGGKTSVMVDYKTGR